MVPKISRRQVEGISLDEYQSRQNAARAIAQSHGYDLLLAWARGASTQDHAADVLYLTGHYTPQGFVPDTPLRATLYPEEPVCENPTEWRWRAAGHAAVVVPGEGPVTLLTDSAPHTDSPAVADRVIVAADLVAAAGEVLAEFMTALRDKMHARSEVCSRIALLGVEALSSRWHQALLNQLASEHKVQFVDADELSWALRKVKSAAEQELLRASGALGARALSIAMETAVVGATEADVVAACAAEVFRGGGAWYGGGLSSGACADTFAPTGRLYGAAPSTSRRLETGDLVRFDAYGSFAGYVFDFARSWTVGRQPTYEQQLLLDAVRDSVQAGICMLRPGVTLGQVAQRCEEVLSASRYARRYGVPASIMGGAWGHGLGLAFEPPWITLNSDLVVEAGMCFAVERRIAAPDGPVDARGAQYEDNVLISADGAELLTPAP